MYHSITLFPKCKQYVLCILENSSNQHKRKIGLLCIIISLLTDFSSNIRNQTWICLQYYLQKSMIECKLFSNSMIFVQEKCFKIQNETLQKQLAFWNETIKIHNMLKNSLQLYKISLVGMVSRKKFFNFLVTFW